VAPSPLRRSQRTGVSLAAASAGWMRSGLSASPLINGLLHRSAALGTVLGCLGMALAAEALGLAAGRVLIVVGFLVAAVVLPGRKLRR